MARAKTRADAVRNIRRRAKTRIKQLEKQRKNLLNSGASTAGIDRTIERIKDLEYKSRAQQVPGKKIKRLNSQSFEAAEILNKMLPNSRGTNKYKESVARRNKIFSTKLNLAAQDKGTGDLTKERVSLFYRATMDLWQGKKLKDRNAAIIQGLGVDTIEEAYNLIMSPDNKALVEIIENMQLDERERYDVHMSIGGLVQAGAGIRDIVSVVL